MTTTAYIIDEEAEKKKIISLYRQLMKATRPIMEEGDEKIIKKAFNLAVEAHKNVRRKSGEPYIYHPIAVAQICIDEIGLGTTSIVCALLHDVVEDTDTSLEDINTIFGPKVAQIIDGLTKISGAFEYGSSEQAENFRKMLLTLSEDVRVILIKLADRLHNMRTLGSMPKEKQLKIASETLYLYAPLAHRLGLHAIKSEMEDLCLKYREPETFRDIKYKLNENKKTRDAFIKQFIAPIDVALAKTGLKYTIKGRPKSIFSINNKIKNSGTDFRDIYDLFAVRIVIDVPIEQEKAACWQAYSIVTDFYRPNADRLKDFISNPKSNGYESLHTTVMSKQDEEGRWVEVQVRSLRMDEIAEKGFAAHWKYKGNDTRNSTAFETWLSDIRESLEKNDKSRSAVDFVEEMRSSLVQEEVFVFTPKGKLIVLPNGATALDFAYSIHSAVGSKCIGAKINHRLVPISHKLSNGDQVEIMTSAKQKPSEDWLRFVITSKAKANIKDAIKEANKRYVTGGKELIETRLKLLGVGYLTLEITNQLRAYFNAKDTNDLFYRFGKAYLQPEELKRWKIDREAHERKQAEKTIKQPIDDVKSFVKEIKKAHGDRKDADFLLIGEDMDKVDYTLSKCCNPIAGDEVFGFVTVNEGIKIHRNNCPNATELLSRHGSRAIKAKWASQIAMSFTAHVVIRGIDRVGLVKDVTSIISVEQNVNIQSLSIGVKDGIFEGNIALIVQDTQHLDKLVVGLETIEGVIEVARVTE